MNPFHHSLEDNFRGRYVRGVSNDGTSVEGWVERIHHHDRHVVLRDATNLSTGEQVGAALLAHVDILEETDSTSRIEAVRPSELEPSPYHAAEFNAAENRGYLKEVREREFAGSFPVARELADGTLEIVEGHKRLWVCEQANLSRHPVEIIDLADWGAALRFVVDHLPHEGHVHDGETTEDGYYDSVEIRESIQALVERWGDRARDLDRVAFNADRLGIDIPTGESAVAADTPSDDDDGRDEDAAEVLADLDRDEDGTLDHTNEDHLQRAYDAYDGVVADAVSEFSVGYGAVYSRMREFGVHESTSTETPDEDTNESDVEEADTDAEIEAWCGWCGKGFETEQGAKIHCGRTHDEIIVFDKEPDLECENCGRMFPTYTERSTHLHGSCGAVLPDRLSEDDFRKIVENADTVLEVDREIRELNRGQVKNLLKEYDLLGEVGTGDARSPKQLLDSVGLDEADTDAETEGDDSWKRYTMRGESDD